MGVMAYLLIYLLGWISTAAVIVAIESEDGHADAADCFSATFFGFVWPIFLPLMLMAGLARLFGLGLAAIWRRLREAAARVEGGA